MKRKVVSTALTVVFLFSAMFVRQAVTPARAGESDGGYPVDLYEAPEGYAEIVWGTYFEVVDSTYLNITITSTVAVNVSLESDPGIVSFVIEGNGSETTTDLAFTGFEPSTTYYRHQDGYLVEEFTTDSSGGYAYTQDISEPHHVYILEHASPLHISSDYTFASDISEPIVVCADNVVIDGDGYTLQGPGSGYGFYLYGRSGVTIKNVTVKGWTDGVAMFSSSSNTIKYSTITSNSRFGIQTYYGSSYNVIANCDVSYNEYDGINLRDCRRQRHNTIVNSRVYSNVRFGIVGYVTTDYTKVINNTVYSNLGDGIRVGWSTWTIENNTVYDNNGGGIGLDTVRYCTVKNNNVYLNNYGIFFSGLGSYYNTIVNNTISLNNGGIGLYYTARYNTIKENTVFDNEYGLRIAHHAYLTNYGNLIYHNNFIDNTYQALDDGVWNTWDDGYPSGGNYWSDYTGVDQYSGSNQDQPSSDGIGDTPYDIPGIAGSQDRYPLIITIPATIDIDPDTLNLKSNGQWITAYITLPEGYNVEDIVLETVYLDGIEAAWSEIQDGVYMAKFDRALVRVLSTGMPDYEAGEKFFEVPLTVTGELVDGTPFEGSDTTTVIHD